MKIGPGKKIIGAQGIGLVLFLLFAIFSYTSLTSYSAMHKRGDELALMIELAADLQNLLQKILMPPQRLSHNWRHKRAKKLRQSDHRNSIRL